MDQLANELKTTRTKIQGWFKHMRTAVGKLYKTKSGKATQSLTARKKWQLENFAFLKAHIVPRTYAVETTPFDLDETDEQSQNEEPVPSIPTRPASPSASTSDRKTKPLVCKKSKIDDLLMKFLDRPTPDDVFSKQLERVSAAHASATQQPDERTAFSQWIGARISGIPQDRWDDFQFAAMRLMQDFSRPRPNPDTSPIPTSQPSPMPPVQQQWSQYPYQQQQWSQMQTWQQQLPPRQQWGAFTMVQQPSQPSFSSQPQNQLSTLIHLPATAQPPEGGAPRSQSVPPALESSPTGSVITELFINQLAEGISSDCPSGVQEGSGED